MYDKKELEEMSSDEILSLLDGTVSDGELLDHILVWLDEDTLKAMLIDFMVDSDLVN